MAQTSAELANQFRQDMSYVIGFWRKIENDFFQDLMSITASDSPEDIQLKQHFRSLGKQAFPHELYNMWKHTSYLGGEYSESWTTDDIVDQVRSGGAIINDKKISFNEKNKTKIKTNLSMSKGEAFEEFGIVLLQNSDLINRIRSALCLSFQPTGAARHREDIELTEEYTLDFKYSEQSGVERFKNIIKLHGSKTYASIFDIENSIIDSLYTWGASNGYATNSTGATTNTGIYERPKIGRKDRGFQEKEEFRGKKDLHGLSFTRKILMYAFVEDWYWASDCLEKVVDWAANRLMEVKWQNLNTRKKARIPNPVAHQKAFWDWEKNSLDILRENPTHSDFKIF